MPASSFGILVCGLLSTFTVIPSLKLLLYCAGVLIFCLMVRMMNSCIEEASDNGENIFHGSSFLRALVVIILVTWFPFPIWYALSPEGFGIINNAAGMKVVVSFLNVLSKGAFMMYVARIRTDHITRQRTLVAIGYVGDEREDMRDDENGLPAMDASRKKMDQLDKITSMHIKDVLASMGRSKDYDWVVELMISNLITGSDDILTMTPDYCQEIGLPWGFIQACKSKIRSHKIQGDSWSVHRKVDDTNEKSDFDICLSAPHILRNKEKLEYVISSMPTDMTSVACDTSSKIDMPSFGSIDVGSIGPNQNRLDLPSVGSIDVGSIGPNQKRLDLPSIGSVGSTATNQRECNSVSSIGSLDSRTFAGKDQQPGGQTNSAGMGKSNAPTTGRNRRGSGSRLSEVRESREVHNDQADVFSDVSSPRSPRSPRSPKSAKSAKRGKSAELPNALDPSHKKRLREPRSDGSIAACSEYSNLSSILDDQERKVEEQLAESQQFLVSSFSKVLDVIERRMTENTAHEAAAPAPPEPRVAT
jgi:hypothetical protein